jgi:putative transposase
MKTSRYSDSQVMAILKQAEAGLPIDDLCREHGMSSAPFYKWRTKIGDMDASLMTRIKELEDESRRLKKMYAQGWLKYEVIQEAMVKSGEAIFMTQMPMESVEIKRVSISLACRT